MKRLKKVLSHILVVAFIVTNILAQYETAFAKAQKADTPNNTSVRKEILVTYKDNTKKEKVKQSVKGKISSKINVKKTLEKKQTELLEVEGTEDIEKVINTFQNDPNVQYAQPNYRLSIFGSPADPRFTEQWGLYNNGQNVLGETGMASVDIAAQEAWNITMGNPSIIIGVLDTGIDTTHPDLKNNIFINSKEIPANGIDDDSNGYIDDVTGYDFINHDNSVYDGKDLDKHGTHIAGIIGASANSEGVRGVAPNIKILPLKFINGSFGYTSDAIEAIEYAKAMGVKVINSSWGGTEYNPALKESMENSGILFVCAAGNTGSDTAVNPVYPASFGLANTVAVAAVNNKGNLAPYSNYGPNINIVAPGSNILSTLPENNYGIMSGTSMAAPFVTGVASLFLSANPETTFKDIKSRLEQSTTKLPQLSDKIGSGGMVNASKMLEGSQSTGQNDNSNDSTNGNTNGNTAPGANASEFDKKIEYPFAFSSSMDVNNNRITKMNFINTGLVYQKIQLIISEPEKKEAVYNETLEADVKEFVLDKLVPGTNYTFNIKYIRGEVYQSYLGQISTSAAADANTSETSESGSMMDGIINETVDSNAINSGISPQGVETMAIINEVEPPSNGSYGTAVPINSGDDIYGKLAWSGDADYYKITFNKAGKARVWLGNVPSGKDYDIYFYDETYKEIAKSTNSLNADETMDAITVQANKTYYIKVGGYLSQYDPNGTYWLRVKNFPPPTASFTTPQGGASYRLGQTLPITVSGTDSHHMGLFINDTYIPESYVLGNNLSYSYVPNQVGTYKITVKARNTESDTDLCTATVESTIYITVLPGLPTVAFSSPQAGNSFVLGQVIPISVTGTNSHHMSVFINDVYIPESLVQGNSLNYNYTPSTAGSYKINVKARNTENATDLGSEVAEATVNVTVVIGPSNLTLYSKYDGHKIENIPPSTVGNYPDYVTGDTLIQMYSRYDGAPLGGLNNPTPTRADKINYLQEHYASYYQTIQLYSRYDGAPLGGYNNPTPTPAYGVWGLQGSYATGQQSVSVYRKTNGELSTVIAADLDDVIAEGQWLTGEMDVLVFSADRDATADIIWSTVKAKDLKGELGKGIWVSVNLGAIGLGEKVEINGAWYSYLDLIKEQPVLGVPNDYGIISTGPKVNMLQRIYRGFGFQIDDVNLGYYDTVDWQTIGATRALMAYFGNTIWTIQSYTDNNSDVGRLTWPKISMLIHEFEKLSDLEKTQVRQNFYEVQQKQIERAEQWEYQEQINIIEETLDKGTSEPDWDNEDWNPELDINYTSTSIIDSIGIVYDDIRNRPMDFAAGIADGLGDGYFFGVPQRIVEYMTGGTVGTDTIAYVSGRVIGDSICLSDGIGKMLFGVLEMIAGGTYSVGSGGVGTLFGGLQLSATGAATIAYGNAVATVSAGNLATDTQHLFAKVKSSTSTNAPRKPSPNNPNLIRKEILENGSTIYTMRTKTGRIVEVKYSKAGYPDFSPYKYKGTDGLAEVKVRCTGDRTKDFRLADEAAGFTKRPDGYTWHHVEDGETLILVEREVHETFAHTGGFALSN